MKIIGFNLKKINAERKKILKGKLDIQTNLTIDSVEKEDVDIAGEILKFSYTYSIKYEPGFAELTFSGDVLLIPDKIEDIKKIVKDWKKNKLPDEIRIPIINFVMSKCSLKALQLEEEFSIPPHIPLPRVSNQPNQPQANYAG